MGNFDEQENLNLPQSSLTEFFDDVEGKLAMLSGLIDPSQFDLTIEDIRRPVLVIGKPAIGKTEGLISSIKEMNKRLEQEGKDVKIGFKKILLGQTVVGSLSGIPIAKPDGTVVRIQMPDLPDPERDGEVGVLFLDEITTADEMQIQPALGLADDSRSLGEYTLPEKWMVVGAGNGPDCTNFVRLDDMTLSRFNAFDILYDYKKDFRPYAHRVGIHEDIIAFLNFNPDICVRVESSDMDKAAKQFPAPRTWRRLSSELKIQAARGREISPEDMTNFAGRIIGTNAAREFSAFLMFKKNLNYDINKILAGTERDPEVGMAKETYHIILQGLFKAINEDLKPYNGDVPKSLYSRCANMLKWIMKFHELENKINAIYEIRDDLRAVALLIFDDDFCKNYCPEFDAFLDEHMELLSSNIGVLGGLRV